MVLDGIITFCGSTFLGRGLNVVHLDIIVASDFSWNTLIEEVITTHLNGVHIKISHVCQPFGKPILFVAAGWRTYASMRRCIGSSLVQIVAGGQLGIKPYPRVTLYTAGHLHTAVPHCSHSRAPIVHTAVPRENNEHGCVYLRCRAVCKLPGCVEGHPWYQNQH